LAVEVDIHIFIIAVKIAFFVLIYVIVVVYLIGITACAKEAIPLCREDDVGVASFLSTNLQKGSWQIPAFNERMDSAR